MKGRYMIFMFWIGDMAYMVKPTIFQLIRYKLKIFPPLLIFVPNDFKRVVENEMKVPLWKDRWIHENERI